MTTNEIPNCCKAAAVKYITERQERTKLAMALILQINSGSIKASMTDDQLINDVANMFEFGRMEP